MCVTRDETRFEHDYRPVWVQLILSGWGRRISRPLLHDPPRFRTLLGLGRTSNRPPSAVTPVRLDHSDSPLKGSSGGRHEGRILENFNLPFVTGNERLPVSSVGTTVRLGHRTPRGRTGAARGGTRTRRTDDRTTGRHRGPGGVSEGFLECLRRRCVSVIEGPLGGPRRGCREDRRSVWTEESSDPPQSRLGGTGETRKWRSRRVLAQSGRGIT